MSNKRYKLKERNYFFRCCYDKLCLEIDSNLHYLQKLIKITCVLTFIHCIIYTCILCFNSPQEGLVYAVEFSHRSGRDLINVAKKRTNVIPIIEDARHPHKYRMLVGKKFILNVQYRQLTTFWMGVKKNIILKINGYSR